MSDHFIGGLEFLLPVEESCDHLVLNNTLHKTCIDKKINVTNSHPQRNQNFTLLAQFASSTLVKYFCHKKIGVDLFHSSLKFPQIALKVSRYPLKKASERL